MTSKSLIELIGYSGNDKWATRESWRCWICPFSHSLLGKCRLTVMELHEPQIKPVTCQQIALESQVAADRTGTVRMSRRLQMTTKKARY